MKKEKINLRKNKHNQFQLDLLKHKYHIFNLDSAKVEGFYPSELLKIINEIFHFKKKLKIKIGTIYTVRAFFAIAEPIDNEVEYESGYLDLKLIMRDNDIFVGEVITELPSMFEIKKGSKIKIKKENIIYQPNYK